jgi:hypothetical protein
MFAIAMSRSEEGKKEARILQGHRDAAANAEWWENAILRPFWAHVVLRR